MTENVAELERRYQLLSSQYQSGKITEENFTAEVDKLQFQDTYGRYWMIGAQSGAWHYYDGQAWHQANPNESDKLPFMDAQGTYWQRGAKSGDWYYFRSESNEWVKPDQGDPSSPTIQQTQPPQSTNTYSSPQPQAQPGYSQQPQEQAAGQVETQLFQDDDGRYWSLGSKSGQWYFYDSEGWHPAQEFETRTGIPQPAHNFPPAYPTAGQPGASMRRPTRQHRPTMPVNHIPASRKLLCRWLRQQLPRPHHNPAPVNRQGNPAPGFIMTAINGCSTQTTKRLREHHQTQP